MKKAGLYILAIALLVMLCGCSCTGSQVTSDSDLPDVADEPVVWEQAASEDEYFDMMQAKLSEYIRCMTALSEMEQQLSELGTADKITADADFSALSEQLAGWCEGADSYPEETLINDRAISVCQQTRELAGATAVYLEKLPSLLSGADDVGISLADYQNSIVDNAISIYELLNTEAD